LEAATLTILKFCDSISQVSSWICLSLWWCNMQSRSRHLSFLWYILLVNFTWFS
jgi:hypothetical protein